VREGINQKEKVGGYQAESSNIRDKRDVFVKTLDDFSTCGEPWRSVSRALWIVWKRIIDQLCT